MDIVSGRGNGHDHAPVGRTDGQDIQLRPARVTLVAPDDIPAIWHEVRESVVKGLKEGDGNFHERDILACLLMEQMTLWRCGSSALVCQIIRFPRKKVCHFLVLGGEDMRDWLPMLTEVEKWAIKLGCDRLEELGRQGWIRVLKDRGWEQAHYQMRKTL